jgi:small subunit ribosomal protein S16
MPVRIRLQRHGKKGKPFYWIVAADSRSKRDGRYLEKLGAYNPNTNPATVEVDLEGAVKWLENGAQPSDTARTLLSYRGAMIKHHLNGGVRKGAFSQEEADKKFTAWLEEKQSKIQAKIDTLDKDKASDLAKRLEAEKAINQKRIADLLPKPEVKENEDVAAESVEGETSELSNEEAALVDETDTEKVTTDETAVEEATEGEVTAEKPTAKIIEEAPATEEVPATEEEGSPEKEENKE